MNDFHGTEDRAYHKAQLRGIITDSSSSSSKKKNNALASRWIVIVELVCSFIVCVCFQSTLTEFIIICIGRLSITLRTTLAYFMSNPWPHMGRNETKVYLCQLRANGISCFAFHFQHFSFQKKLSMSDTALTFILHVIFMSHDWFWEKKNSKSLRFHSIQDVVKRKKELIKNIRIARNKRTKRSTE